MLPTDATFEFKMYKNEACSQSFGLQWTITGKAFSALLIPS